MIDIVQRLKGWVGLWQVYSDDRGFACRDLEEADAEITSLRNELDELSVFVRIVADCPLMTSPHGHLRNLANFKDEAKALVAKIPPEEKDNG